MSLVHLWYISHEHRRYPTRVTVCVKSALSRVYSHMRSQAAQAFSSHKSRWPLTLRLTTNITPSSSSFLLLIIPETMAPFCDLATALTPPRQVPLANRYHNSDQMITAQNPVCMHNGMHARLLRTAQNADNYSLPNQTPDNTNATNLFCPMDACMHAIGMHTCMR